MRKINKVIVHITASKKGDVNTVRKWHTWPKDNSNGTVRYMGKDYVNRECLPPKMKNKHGNGWDDIGYHYIIRKSGKLEVGRPVEVVGSHCYGHNRDSIGVALEGQNFNDLTDIQLQSLTSHIKGLMLVYTLKIEDGYTHNYFDKKKECPCFSVGYLRGIVAQSEFVSKERS